MIDAFIRRKRAGERLAMLTAYDYPTARLLDEEGVDLLLVGDSLGMVVLGLEDTTGVTLDAMVHHTRAVARAARRAPVVADLPFQTYGSPEQAVASARALAHAGAAAVKLEGGREMADRIAAIRADGIHAMGHIGMLPQHVREEGGYKIKGRTEDEADRLVDDAKALQDAGAFALVAELVLPATTARIRDAVDIPVIGIGSGEACDGQVLVIHDLAGLFPWFTPKFAKPRADAAGAIRQAAREFIADVKHPGTPPEPRA
jgi:3-methyl-2-oxobutanoate hydroxymethyltransferase